MKNYILFAAMRLLNLNDFVERVKEPPVNCPACLGVLDELPDQFTERIRRLFSKKKLKLKRYRCRDCRNIVVEEPG